MQQMKIYPLLSRAKWLSYRGKIMLTAFVGTHVPLLVLISTFAWWTAPDLERALLTIAIALAATLAGTGFTLLFLNGLLQPIMLTARGLAGYASNGRLPHLPTGFTDEVGQLMRDADNALVKLDGLVQQLSFCDPDTGLPNRQQLMLRMRQMIEAHPNRAFALKLVRFGNHARLISTFGKETADRSLRVLANRLETVVRRDTLIARLDSDIFALVVPVGEGSEAGTAELERLIATVSGAMWLDQIEVLPDLSAGAAVYPLDGIDATTVLDHATLALDHASAVPGQRIAFFAPRSKELAIERFRVEQDLRRAIEQNELFLHYQPAIDIEQGKICSVEALVRWQHPRLGLISPSVFIPIAEQAGLDGDIGRWVLRQVCTQIGEWKGQLPPVKVGVNISAGQFLDGSLPQHIAGVLHSHRIDPSSLEIELTETTAMKNEKHTRAVFAALQEMGLSIAIDDFGTGYSSMSYLMKLPFDRLKVDREFVHNVGERRDSQAICKAVVELARGLNLEVVAEGTETEAEVRALRAMGCRVFQGFYFSRPLAPSSVPDFFKSARWESWRNISEAA